MNLYFVLLCERILSCMKFSPQKSGGDSEGSKLHEGNKLIIYATSEIICLTPRQNYRNFLFRCSSKLINDPEVSKLFLKMT